MSLHIDLPVVFLIYIYCAEKICPKHPHKVDQNHNGMQASVIPTVADYYFVFCDEPAS